MSEAPDGNGPVVEIEVNAGAEGSGETSGGGEVGEAAAVEQVAEAAVEVARIEAEADVEIARIEADASIEHHELAVAETQAIAEAIENSETQEWRARAEAAEAELAVLKSSTQQPSPEDPPSQPVEVVELESESTAEGGQKESHEEPAAAPEPEKPKRRPHRWI